MNPKLSLIIFVVFSHTLLSQEKHTYQQPLEGFAYIDIVRGVDNGKLPLLIAFHYSSGNPLETLGDYDSLKNPVRIVIPKGNYGKRSGFTYYPPDYYKKDSVTQFSLSKITTDSIARFVQAIENKYKQKAIVCGISQGGDIAFLLARYYRSYVKRLSRLLLLSIRALLKRSKLKL